ncbi:MAG: hypothetical protein EBQ59_08530 [Verrucomicrobia bacterium]|nr:hypothetical protein [Verrucomicrobiota bacterium]
MVCFLSVETSNQRFTPKHNMKNTLSILSVLALAAAAQAGCGKTATSEGTLKSYDAEKKEIVVSVKGKDSTVTVTPETKGAAGLKDLVGKAVKVEASVHDKVKALSVEAGVASTEEKPAEKKKKKKA